MKRLPPVRSLMLLFACPWPLSCFLALSSLCPFRPLAHSAGVFFADRRSFSNSLALLALKKIRHYDTGFLATEDILSFPKTSQVIVNFKPVNRLLEERGEGTGSLFSSPLLSSAPACTLQLSLLPFPTREPACSGATHTVGTISKLNEDSILTLALIRLFTDYG